MMSNLQMALYTLGVFGFIMLILGAMRWKESKNKNRKKRPIAFYIGWLLIGFALYVLPFGVMDLYEITEISLNLTYIENYILWIGISVAAIAIGIMLIRRKKT